MRKPNPSQPGRCPSIDPYGDLQCGRPLHDDDQCQFGGIAWKKGTAPVPSDVVRAAKIEALLDAADAWAGGEWRDVNFNKAGRNERPWERQARWLRDRAAALADEPTEPKP